MSSEIVLVNLSGRNKPGLLGMLFSALARYRVHVLDLGQAVIHNELNLGMLLEIPHEQDAASVLKDLLFQAHELGAVIRFTPVPEADYEDWVRRQGRPRYIITLLASGITAEHLAAVTAVVERHGLAVDGIRRLSGRVPLVHRAPSRPSRESIEMKLRGTLEAPASLKAELLEAAGRLVFDFSVQEDTVYRRNRRLVAFDMDSTLIQAEVIDELARLHGVGEQVAAITEQAMRGECDFQESFRARASLLAGLPEAALEEVATTVPVTEGAHRLVSTLKHFGYRTAIISGGFTYVGEHLQRRLGIDYVHANQLVVENGHITGEVQGSIVDAAGKARLLRQLCEQEGIVLEQAIAIGDGANDLPMLDAAGLGVAFHAKAVVRETASHAISNFGLDSVLYLIGFSDRDIEQVRAEAPAHP